MNSPSLLQTIANLCVGLAAVIYGLPLQWMFFEALHRRNGQTDHGAGLFVMGAILVAMWVLLLIGLCCVIASGGLDGMGPARGGWYPLATGAALSMLALSFFIFEVPRHPDFLTRILGRMPFHAFPVATMAMIVLSMNPRLTAGIPLTPVQLTWLGCAGLSLLLCGGYLGYRFAVPVLGRAVGLGTELARRGPTDRDTLSRIATLDPQRDFADLLRLTHSSQRRAVRESATARLRSHPDYLEALVATLTSHPSEPALEFIYSATLLPSEQALLALPARTALEEFIAGIPAPNFMPSTRRRQLLRWGRETLPVIAEKLSIPDVDFSGIMPAFEEALRPDETRRR
ncbi:MAG: hypothetical protein KF833_09700 [Verrucomicrobiae bacterium]|nr:hypothetical protein [Verrucomicrobiae bacterium]